MKLKIYLNDKSLGTREYDEPVCIKDIAEEMQEDHPYQIVCARFERHLKSLNHVLKRSGTLELLDMRDSDGKMCYQASLSLLYSKAVQDVAGTSTVFINQTVGGVTVAVPYETGTFPSVSAVGTALGGKPLEADTV